MLQFWLIKILKQPIFIAQIENGVIVKEAGSVKNGFINECKEVLSRNGVATACIYACKNQYGNRIVNVTGPVTADVVQQIRNLWSFY